MRLFKTLLFTLGMTYSLVTYGYGDFDDLPPKDIYPDEMSLDGEVLEYYEADIEVLPAHFDNDYDYPVDPFDDYYPDYDDEEYP